MNPHVYILILNWNGKSVLEACIDSVLKIDYSNYTILVIDNNSSDLNDIPAIEMYDGLEAYFSKLLKDNMFSRKLLQDC